MKAWKTFYMLTSNKWQGSDASGLHVHYYWNYYCSKCYLKYSYILYLSFVGHELTFGTSSNHWIRWNSILHHLWLSLCTKLYRCLRLDAAFCSCRDNSLVEGVSFSLGKYTQLKELQVAPQYCIWTYSDYRMSYYFLNCCEQLFCWNHITDKHVYSKVKVAFKPEGLCLFWIISRL